MQNERSQETKTCPHPSLSRGDSTSQALCGSSGLQGLGRGGALAENRGNTMVRLCALLLATGVLKDQATQSRSGVGWGEILA